MRMARMLLWGRYMTSPQTTLSLASCVTGVGRWVASSTRAGGEERVVKIVHEAGGYVAECRCGWAKWSTHKPHVEQAAMAHAERCQEMEESC